MAYNAASLLDNDMRFKVGEGLDELSASYDRAQKERDIAAAESAAANKEMGKAAASGMSSGAGLGGTLLGAGLTGTMYGAKAGPYAAAAGLALGLWEQQKKNEAAAEQARAQEAENRKAATQNAINSMINVTRGLGV